MLPTIAWMRGAVRLIDQRQLPGRERYLTCRRWEELGEAIRSMAIRGAPAIGVAGGYGLALAARAGAGRPLALQRRALERAAAVLEATRPTAVNLRWALHRVRRVWRRSDAEAGRLPREVWEEARAIEREDLAMNAALSRAGSRLIPRRARVLTYCNTGGLATAGVGTALGVLKACHDQGKRIHVYTCETRPALQGLRLTTWELRRARMPFTVLTDNMAGWLMREGRVDAVIVGADRIARNGDTANKIGTYSLAVLAHRHGIPFYVAAPSSTVDASIRSGREIPIEERAMEEVFAPYLPRFRPGRVRARHPAFDVTPSELIKAIITERGVHRAPYRFRASA